MNRKDRRAAQKRGGPVMSPMTAMLADGFRAHQAGHRSDAERLYRDVLSAEPRNAAAMHLLGTLLHQGGRNVDAISLIQQAIAVEPNDADYRYNLGFILLSAGRVEEAIPHLEKATALKPSYAAAHFELSNALARAGRLAEAEKSLRRVNELQPGNADTLNNLGLLAMRQGRRDDAMALWRRALQSQPDLALAHFNIGLAELDAGRAEQAEDNLRRTLAAMPDHPEATHRLAVSLLAQGKSDDAFPLASEALSKRETDDTRATFARCLLSVTAFNPDSALRERLRRALQEAWLPPHDLAPLCASVLRAHPVIGPAILRVTEQWPKASMAQQHPVISDAEVAAAEEPLFGAYLETTPNYDVGIELFLTALRANLLDRAARGENAPQRLLNVCASIARQCFINEYVFQETASETARAVQLVAIAQSAIRSGAALAPFQLAALAMYRSLYSLESAERLLTRDWPAAVSAILQQQIAEPAEEAVLRDTTPKLTAIDEATSVAVRAQYEQNPYPRWVQASSTASAHAIGDVLRRSIPLEDLPAIAPVSAPDVLVAGCGTGLQAVTAAQSYSNARILAIDLSTSSLAYARRQAARLNLANIEFAQADILKLDSLDRRFDVIECAGVLHHLADPYAGWRTLLSLLRPGGLMSIALYSDIARRDVVAARDFAAAGNYQPDLEGIRRCRQAILRLPQNAKARQILISADFYSTSSFRDLVMHEQEHRMSLPDIQAFLAANRLEFIGFEVIDPVRREFNRLFPDPRSRKDLAAWHQFETEHPDTFVGMYQFWVRKPPDA